MVHILCVVKSVFPEDLESLFIQPNSTWLNSVVNLFCFCYCINSFFVKKRKEGMSTIHSIYENLQIVM